MFDYKLITVPEYFQSEQNDFDYKYIYIYIYIYIYTVLTMHAGSTALMPAARHQ